MTCLLIKIYALDKKKDIEKYHLASPTQQTCHCPFSQKKKKKNTWHYPRTSPNVV